MSVKRLAYGLLTALRIKDMGFFIPHRYASQRDRRDDTAPWIYKWFSEKKTETFLSTLKLISGFEQDLRKIDCHSVGKNQPRWYQDWFPGLDAAVAYSLVSCLLYTSPSPRD